MKKILIIGLIFLGNLFAGGYNFSTEKECLNGVGYYATYTSGKRVVNKTLTPVVNEDTLTFERCTIRVERVCKEIGVFNIDFCKDKEIYIKKG
jgi:hypothetical protein